MRFIPFFLFFFPSLFSQTTLIDSLKLVVSKPSTDSNYVKNLVNLSWKLRNAGENDSALAYCKKAERMALAQGYKKLLGKSLTISGIIFMDKGEYDSCRTYYLASLKVREVINDKKGIAACYNNLGNLYEATGDLPRALQMQLAALKIREEINDKQDIAASYNNLGNIYNGMNNREMALKNFLASLKVREEIGDHVGMALSLGNLGLVYEDQNQHEKALEYYNRSLAIEKETGYKLGMGDCYNNMGEVYHKRGMQQITPAAREKWLEIALLYYDSSMRVRTEIGDKQGLTTSYSNLGSVDYGLGKFSSAESYSLKALKMATELNDVDLLKDIHKNLSDVYTAQKRYVEALEHYELSIAARDSLNNETNTKKAVQMEMQYEFDKKEEEARIELQKKEAVAAFEQKRRNIILASISCFGLIGLGFAMFAYRSMVRKKKANIRITRQKEIIEEKQKEILDSIYYARRIQRSLLTSERYISKHLDALRRS